jgi:hypothetical protein
MRAVTAPSVSNGPSSASSIPGSAPSSQSKSTMLRGRSIIGCASAWISAPSRPGTGLGVVTTPAPRSACAQASSEALAAIEGRDG